MNKSFNACYWFKFCLLITLAAYGGDLREAVTVEAYVSHTKPGKMYVIAPEIMASWMDDDKDVPNEAK
ncbi:MAG: hypothetical protein R6T89_03630 [Candidatus Syntrophosphaera sp.]